MCADNDVLRGGTDFEGEQCKNEKSVLGMLVRCFCAACACLDVDSVLGFLILKSLGCLDVKVGLDVQVCVNFDVDESRRS